VSAPPDPPDGAPDPASDPAAQRVAELTPEVRPDPATDPTIVERLLTRDKRALGRAVSMCEDSRAQAAAGRAQLVASLASHPARRRARLVGVTGPPASGKSSLIAELAVRLVALRPEAAVAVLAVDPSSPGSGGALLGDRVRARFPPGDRRLYFRSQASDLELGGLGRTTFPVCRLLQHLFDCVFVETVGVGQSEVDVHKLVDHTYLVLPPAWGDGVQLMKAGILEIPDSVILSKQDLELSGPGGSARLASALERGPRAVSVHRVSVHTGSGLDRLVGEIADLLAGDRNDGKGAPLDGREGVFFARWVLGEFGRQGIASLAARGLDPDQFVRDAGGYDGAVAAFPSSYRCWLCD
jgi:LAO/AO transport system kinase